MAAVATMQAVEAIKVEKKSNKDLQKTRLCVYNLEGKCGFGADCAFAHNSNEIRGVPDLSKTQLCTKFMEGTCNNKNCTYAHGAQELRDPPNFKKKICKWNQKGQCRNGIKCGFAHSVKEVRGEVEPPPGFEAKPKVIAPPPGLEKMGPEDGYGSSTDEPSSSVSNLGSEPELPEAHLFRMAAARGAAPIQTQVSLMSSAIMGLQAKLEQLEGMMMDTQAMQMQSTIQQLQSQCLALESGFYYQAEEPAVTSEPTKLSTKLSAKAAPFVPFVSTDMASDESTSMGSDSD